MKRIAMVVVAITAFFGFTTFSLATEPAVQSTETVKFVLAETGTTVFELAKQVLGDGALWKSDALKLTVCKTGRSVSKMNDKVFPWDTCVEITKSKPAPVAVAKTVTVKLEADGKMVWQIAKEHLGDAALWKSDRVQILHPTLDQELSKADDRKFPVGARMIIALENNQLPQKPQPKVAVEPVTKGETTSRVPEFTSSQPEDAGSPATLDQPTPWQLEIPLMIFNIILKYGVIAISIALVGFSFYGLVYLTRQAQQNERTGKIGAGRVSGPLVLLPIRTLPERQRLIKNEEEVRTNFLQSFGDTFAHAALRGFGEAAETQEVRVLNASELVIEIGFREGSHQPLQFFRQAEELVRQLFNHSPHHEALEFSIVEPSALEPSLGVKIYFSYKGTNGNGTSRAGAQHSRLSATV